MKIETFEVPGLKLITLPVFSDERGSFMERFHIDKFKAAGLPFEFLQDNFSSSKPGVLRGLHFQTNPWQGKLVGVTRGRIWDVAVDLRPHSPTCGQHVAVELSENLPQLFWIPPGFAHGFVVLGDETADVVYKVDGLFNANTDAGIRWDDAELAIPWPVKPKVISKKDLSLPSYSMVLNQVKQMDMGGNL